MDDVTLTFNPGMFLDALGKINLGLETMDKNFKSFSDKSKARAQKTKTSAISIAKGIGLAKVAMAGLNKLMAQVPELGRTFSIVGNIVTKNLLWPLRQELIPILQSVLDWVRDNRAMFLRWGNVLRNIFVAIKNLASGIIRIVKRIWDGFLSGIERAFNTSMGKMSDLANLMIFKISAVVNFLIITLEPVADIVANLFVKMAVNVANFVEGFMEGFGDIGGVLTDAMESLTDLLNLLDRLGGSGETLGKVFKTLGFILGTVVGGAIRTALTLLDGLVMAVNTTVGFVKWGVAKLKGNDLEANKIRKETDQENLRIVNRIKDRGQVQLETTQKGFERLEGREPINYKRLDPSVVNNSASSNTVNQNITINNRIDGAKDPQATGSEVSQQLRNQLAKERAKAGRGH